MHDIRVIRADAAAFDAAMARRGLPPIADDILANNDTLEALQARVQALHRAYLALAA